MTVRAEKIQIPLASLPVRKTAAPTVLSFAWPLLFASINMVDVKDSDVVVSAAQALAAEFSYQELLSLPNSTLSKKFVTVPVPEKTLAFVGTKLRFCRFAALATFAVTWPPLGEIAFGRTVCCVSRACPTFLDIERFAASNAVLRSTSFGATRRSVFALIPNNFGAPDVAALERAKPLSVAGCDERRVALFAVFLHGAIIYAKLTQGYFDIACRRIDEANGKGSLFEGVADSPDLFHGATDE